MAEQDKQIEAQVRERLALNPDLDPSDIRVVVEDGLITLGGPVQSRREKRLAEQAASEVRGALGVDNQLRVAGPGEATERGLQAGQPRGVRPDGRPPLDPSGSA